MKQRVPKFEDFINEKENIMANNMFYIGYSKSGALKTTGSEFKKWDGKNIVDFLQKEFKDKNVVIGYDINNGGWTAFPGHTVTTNTTAVTFDVDGRSERLVKVEQLKLDAFIEKFKADKQTWQFYY